MKINGMGAIKAYRGGKDQEAALIARTTSSKEEQVRIAENSNSRLVLLNLVLNENLESDAVEELFKRKLSYVTERLESLGFKDDRMFKF